MLYLAAGIIFSLGDILHVNFAIAHYPTWDGVQFFNIPCWIPLEFSLASFLLVKTYPWRMRIFGLKPVQIVNRKQILISITMTLLTYFLSSLLSENYFILKNIFIFGVLCIQITYQKAWGIGSWMEMMVLGFSGCFFEFFLGQLNIFSYYSSPSLIGSIPLWLFFIYMSVALTVRKFANYIAIL